MQGVIKTDSYDRSIYDNIRQQAGRMQEVEKLGQQSLNTFPQLMQDTWAGLYKVVPAFNDEIPASLQLNKQILEQAMSLPEWTPLRQTTRLDEWGGGPGGVIIGQEAIRYGPFRTEGTGQPGGRLRTAGPGLPEPG